jgi:hypothetical protein
MATSPEGIMALGQPAEAGEPPSSIQISRNEAYDISRQALNEARPDVSAELEDRLAGFREKARQLPTDILEALVDGFEEALNRKDDYPAFLEEVRKEAPVLLDILPPEYDEPFLSAMYFLLVDALRAKEGKEDIGEGIGAIAPQKFAMGGIAEAARLVASQGRRGDTMLAHINPQEAQLLKALGGAGTINPRTGLHEYGSKKWKKLGKAVGLEKAKEVVDDFVSDARDFIRSDVGGIITQIGITIFLTPFVGPVGAASIASGATTAFRGGDLKDIAKSAALAGATAYFSSPGSPIYNTVSKYTPAFMNNAVVNSAITAQIVGTGAGLLQGQDLTEAAKNGLRDAAITAAGTYASGGTKAQVDQAATNSVANATEVQLQKGAAAAPKLDTLELETPRVQNIANVDAAAMNIDQVAAAQQPSLADTIGTGTQRVLAQAAGASDGTAAVPMNTGLELTPGYMIDGTPANIGSQGNFTYDLDPGSSAYGRAGTPDISGVLPPPDITTPATDIAARQRAAMSPADAAKYEVISGESSGTLPMADVTAGGVSPAAAASPAVPVPDGGIGNVPVTPYKKGGPDLIPSMKKAVTPGTMMEGLEDIFAPGPSKEQIFDFAKKNGMSFDEAEKFLSPNFMRTYGPTAAAGIAGVALAGGFGGPEDPDKTQEQQEFEDRMRMSTPEYMAKDPSRYYIQNVPGVRYDERGTVIGSGQYKPSYGVTDITGGSYSPYTQPAQTAYTPSAFMSPYGEQYLNQGGIATLRAGGYPRRTGQISGPGTETSDSIPAMLSDGEFVMTARAVRGMGNGSRREGARKMYALMHKLENNASRG